MSSVAGTESRTPARERGNRAGVGHPILHPVGNVQLVSDLKLTLHERTAILAYLARVVPRGQEDADLLHQLIELLDSGRRTR